MNDYAYIQKELQRWLYISDPEAVDVLMAVAISNNLPGDPLWLYYVGPSSGGKTEVLRQIQGPSVKTVSTITPSSLISGFAASDPERRKVLDLMATLDKKILIIKDLTSVLSMKPDDSSRVFADLREAYDGYLEKHFGSGTGTISYKAKFTVIAGVTPAIDSARKIHQHLGERFIRVNVMPSDSDRMEMTRRALKNLGTEDEEREKLGRMVGKWLTDSRKWLSPDKPISDHMIERLINLAEFVALMRAEVQRDRERVIQYKPSAEVGARLVKQFAKLGIALANLREHDEVTEDDFLTIRRCAIDCVETRRMEIVNYLVRHRGDKKTSEIAQAVHMPSDTVRSVSEDLEAIGVLGLSGDARLGYLWNLRPRFMSTYSVSVGVTMYPVISLSSNIGGGILHPPLNQAVVSDKEYEAVQT